MEDTQELPMRFETLAVHAGGERDETGAIAPPLHLSTNYEHSPSGEPRHGYLYARMDNPIQRRLESALAAVEGGQAALVFASGVAAGAAYLQSLPAGSHVLFSTTSSTGSAPWLRASFRAGASIGRRST